MSEGFTEKKFKLLLEIRTKVNVFIFNEKLYKQMDGTPMGGCVSLTLAEFFFLSTIINGLNSVALNLSQYFTEGMLTIRSSSSS